MYRHFPRSPCGNIPLFHSHSLGHVRYYSSRLPVLTLSGLIWIRLKTWLLLGLYNLPWCVSQRYLFFASFSTLPLNCKTTLNRLWNELCQSVIWIIGLKKVWISAGSWKLKDKRGPHPICNPHVMQRAIFQKCCTSPGNPGVATCSGMIYAATLLDYKTQMPKVVALCRVLTVWRGHSFSEIVMIPLTIIKNDIKVLNVENSVPAFEPNQ